MQGVGGLGVVLCTVTTVADWRSMLGSGRPLIIQVGEGRCQSQTSGRGLVRWSTLLDGCCW